MIVPAVRCMLGGTEELAGLTTGLDLSGNMTFTFYQVSAQARCSVLRFGRARVMTGGRRETEKRTPCISSIKIGRCKNWITTCGLFSFFSKIFKQMLSKKTLTGSHG